METKVCKNCNMDLPITDYYNRSNKCKECCKKEYRETRGAEVAERKRLKKAMLEEKGVKVCNGCNIELPLSNFKKNNGNYISICGGCCNEKQRERHLKKKIENGYVVKPKLIVKDGFKICNGCELELPISEFYIKNKKRYEGICKKCSSEKNKAYMEKYLSNPVNRERMRDNGKKHKKKKALETKLIRQKLKEDALILLNIEKERKSQELERKRLEKEERNRMIAYKKTDEYKVEQKNKDNARRYERWNNKFKNDPLFALKKRLRTLIRGSFRKSGYTNFAMKTESIVGISYNEFKIYMESKFVNGMTWDNRGEWHIDHIIPLSSAKSEDELIALSHYTNLQPLWAMDNLKKGARVDMI